MTDIWNGPDDGERMGMDMGKDPRWDEPPTKREFVEAELVADYDRTGPPPNLVGMVEGTHQVYDPSERGVRKMPAKETGKHRFAAIATFYLSPEQAEAAGTHSGEVMLDPSNIVMIGIACVDCDTPYEQLRKTCPARPSQWWS